VRSFRSLPYHELVSTTTDERERIPTDELWLLGNQLQNNDPAKKGAALGLWTRIGGAPAEHNLVSVLEPRSRFETRLRRDDDRSDVL
jgi:hypothetical protein